MKKLCESLRGHAVEINILKIKVIGMAGVIAII